MHKFYFVFLSRPVLANDDHIQRVYDSIAIDVLPYPARGTRLSQVLADRNHVKYINGPIRIDIPSCICHGDRQAFRGSGTRAISHPKSDGSGPPATVGMPEMTPLELSVSPAGSVPEAIVQV